jgi:hypothetical protein
MGWLFELALAISLIVLCIGFVNYLNTDKRIKRMSSEKDGDKALEKM